MSKWNKAQKAEIAARVQRDAVTRRKLLASRIKLVTNLQAANNGQAALIAELRAENKRLKDIDNTMKDFDFAKLRKAQDDLADEGFGEVLASRQERRYK